MQAGFAWLKGKQKVPPGTTETEIKYGRAVERTRWPKKGRLYTRPGELHVPIVVETSDGKLRSGDYVIKYSIANEGRLLDYLEPDGKLKTDQLERELAYEAQGEVFPGLSAYKAEELLEKSKEVRGMLQRELTQSLFRMGLSVQKSFVVWEGTLSPPQPELDKFYNERIVPLEKKLSELQKERSRPPGRIEQPTRPVEQEKKENDRAAEYADRLLREQRKPEGSVKKWGGKAEREVSYASLSDAEMRELARREAERYVMLNPRYSSVGEAAFWVNTFEQVFYDALRGVKHGG